MDIPALGLSAVVPVGNLKNPVSLMVVFLNVEIPASKVVLNPANLLALDYKYGFKAKFKSK